MTQATIEDDDMVTRTYINHKDPMQIQIMYIQYTARLDMSAINRSKTKRIKVIDC